jgi:lysophospholipase L1-like esterase
MTKFLASVGLNDSVLFCGDSIIHHTITDGGASPSYVSKINTLYPPYSPIVVDNGVGGQLAYDAEALFAGYLASYPYCSIVTLAWGVNDIVQTTGLSPYQSAMTNMIAMAKAAKRIPVVPTISYGTYTHADQLPNYNNIITGTLWNISGVQRGPDLYTLILNNSATYLDVDGTHFTVAGYTAAAAAWATAMSFAYD